MYAVIPGGHFQHVALLPELLVFRAGEVFDAFDFVEFPVPEDVFAVAVRRVDEAARAVAGGRTSFTAFGFIAFAHFIRWRGGVVDADFVAEIF